MKKQSKGITLIALIITIIILLILAGISISALTKENGLWTQANNAKDKSQKSQVEEEVKLAVMTLQIEASQKESQNEPMTQEDKQEFLEKELKKQNENSTVTKKGTGFLVNYEGYEVEVDSEYKVSIKEPFNAEEWDKTAASEDCFLWGSDVEGEEGYNAIVGWTEKIESYSLLRIPSRCQEIVCDGTYDGVTTSDGKGRAFTKNILKVELPETVTNIGSQAFGGYEWSSSVSFRNVKEINIPESVTSIGKDAFMNLTGLTSITITENVTNIERAAFANCTGLISLIIEEGVRSIGATAFYNCSGLTSIVIPDSVTSIEYRAFGGCESLTNVTIPGSITSIESDMFESCTSLTSVTIQNGVTSIGNYAFDNCTSLTSVTIPDSVTSIGNNTFLNCTGLTSVIIPEGVTSIGDFAFSGCTGLSSITITEGVTSIGYCAFGYTDAPILDTAIYNVVEGSYADTWVQAHKYGNQTINYITK